MFSLQALHDIKTKNSKHLNNENALPVFSKLNDAKYEILMLIEVSDRGFVYKGKDISNKHVLIKEFFPNEALGLEDQLYLERDLDTYNVKLTSTTSYKEKQFQSLVDGFIEEARYLEKISYGDKAFKIIDAFLDRGTAYIVSNFNEWPSIQDFLDTGYVFNQKEFDWIIYNLLEVVERFHRRNIIHRNINPKNIYIKPNEVIINSLETNDFLQEIKVYNADKYHNKFYAPEVIMHNGSIGTWTDIYAIGKIMIEMISSMSSENDYFKGLEKIEEEHRLKLKEVIQSAITFDSSIRIKDAMYMKRKLYRSELKTYRTPKTMIAAIALIAFISSGLVLWQYETITLLASNNNYIELVDEEVPMGPVDVNITNEFFFITKDDTSYDYNEDSIVSWAYSNKCIMKKIQVSGELLKDNVEMNLNEDAQEFNLNIFFLKPGMYEVTIFYEVDGELHQSSLSFKVEE